LCQTSRPNQRVTLARWQRKSVDLRTGEGKSMVQPPPPGGSATLHEEPRGSGRGCAVAVLVSAVLVLVLLGCGGVGLLVWLRGPGGDYAEAPPCALVEESGVLDQLV